MSCKEGNQDILIRMISLLEALDNQTYAQPLEIFKGSSIGQHFRHILDFYLCLIKGINAGTVDYANRDRNPLAESDVQYTKQAFYEVSEAIEQFTEAQNIKVRGDFSAHDIERPELLSSIGREMMFAYDHAIHHLAMIKIGIDIVMPQLNIDNNIGVAPSTIQYRDRILVK